MATDTGKSNTLIQQTLPLAGIDAVWISL